MDIKNTYLWKYLLILVPLILFYSLNCNFLTNLIKPETERKGLSLEPRAEDGSVSGKYHDADGQPISFKVTADGFATFSTEDDSVSVLLSNEESANMTWGGDTFDGLGALEGEEQIKLNNLMNSNLAQSMVMISLDIACQENETIDPKQLAALLFPLQMRFKYLVSDRGAEAEKLMTLSECDYGNETENPPHILFAPSMPVPVVFGYFPFDEEGAAESPMSSTPKNKTACLKSSPVMPIGERNTSNPFAGNSKTFLGSQISEIGPCNALCRGACGASCPLSNCNLHKEIQCEQNEEGKYTGMEAQYLIYNCGKNDGCIEHDACYDTCNTQYGCGSWAAAYCMHGVGILSDLPTIIGHPSWYCDQNAILKYGDKDPSLWAYGYGPQPIRETYTYLNEDYKKKNNFKKCPPGESARPLAESLSVTTEQGKPVDITIKCIHPSGETMACRIENFPANGMLAGSGSIVTYTPNNNFTGIDSFTYEAYNDETHSDPATVTIQVNSTTSPIPTNTSNSHPAMIEPCDFILPEGKISSQSDIVCVAQYSSKPGEKIVQIQSNLGSVDTARLCSGLLEPNDFHVLMNEVDFGDCGIQAEISYKGEPAPGYTGWKIMYYYKGISVRIATNQDYPANKNWVYNTAEAIEKIIKNSLGE